LNNEPVGSEKSTVIKRGDTTFLLFNEDLEATLYKDLAFSSGLKYTLTFFNTSDTIQRIENVLPFGRGVDRVYITADGTYEWPQYLCRSRLNMPGKGPIGVVLPDNAWHLGFNDLTIDNKYSLVALARHSGSNKAELRRWWGDLEPGGQITYNIYFDIHEGEWQKGLEIMFRERFLFDLENFDNSLFDRKDLSWIKHDYIMLLQFAWDHKYYDYQNEGSTFYDYLFEYDDLIGGYDIFTLWPTWPRLGLDPRNQWDMYRDLPGGIEALKDQSYFLHNAGKKFFISYNPWDASTRKEDHLKGMEELLRLTDADGVVLDTRGESSYELQMTADKVKPGIIMYSEGMAIPKDMPGIVSGRVHDALYMPPPLNLNKYIKPDFAIFRVIQLAEGPIHREIAVAFFNGYGIEINTMRPGRPDRIEKEFRYLGKTTKLLRENTTAFNCMDWEPLVPSRKDSIWVNKWWDQNKTIYTVYSLVPGGYKGPLFSDKIEEGYHIVSLWNHVEVNPIEDQDKNLIPIDVEGFSRSLLGTRLEGNVECIAILPEILNVELEGDQLRFYADRGDKIVISAGNPYYDTQYAEFDTGDQTISLYQYFRSHEEKVVVQLFDNEELLDERVVYVKLGTPRLISYILETEKIDSTPEGMLEISSGLFHYYAKRDPSTVTPFIPYPNPIDTVEIMMPRFFMDVYPVTNKDFYLFLQESGYIPEDTCNFLEHWKDGSPPVGMEDHPVVFVGLSDAIAYSDWAGKRLPTEIEWQYAAQGTDFRKYPWGENMDSTLCNYGSNSTSPVDKYPDGASSFGIKDLIGNVWQLTNDVYDNGSYYYGMIRGGSYYSPTSSIWYVMGGPVTVKHPQILLMVSPCLDRCATIGFRCVKDAR